MEPSVRFEQESRPGRGRFCISQEASYLTQKDLLPTQEVFWRSQETLQLTKEGLVVT